MSDIDLQIRAQLSRISPQLQPPQADALIHEFAGCCMEIHDDDQWHRQPDAPASNAFCHVSDIGLAGILRQSGLELFAFATDESLIHEMEDPLCGTEKFEHLARSRSALFETRLTIPLSEAHSWMEAHSRRNEAV